MRSTETKASAEKMAEAPSDPSDEKVVEGPTDRPGGGSVAIIMVALYLAVFLVALVCSVVHVRPSRGYIIWTLTDG